MWVWILSFTVLGSNPDHGRIAKFETKQQCLQALQAKKEEERLKGKEVVGKCFYGKTETKGWW